MVPPSGTREKSPGPGSSFAYRKPKCAPAPPPIWVRTPSPSPNLSSKKKGFTGEHGSPVKSRAARGAVPHCISAEMPRLAPWRVLSWTAPAARSLFARKENGGLGALPLGKEKNAPSGAHREAGPRMARNPSSGPRPQSPRPRAVRGVSFSPGTTKKPLRKQGLLLVDDTGIEPVTSCTSNRRSSQVS